MGGADLKQNSKRIISSKFFSSMINQIYPVLRVVAVIVWFWNVRANGNPKCNVPDFGSLKMFNFDIYRLCNTFLLLQAFVVSQNLSFGNIWYCTLYCCH